MIGPPGSGKSMLAQRLPSLLPGLSPAEALEVTMIHSLAGKLADGRLLRRRPFRDPHHSASLPALVGGGLRARPGEISLAHLGVLFLDELPEFQRSTLEALRQPMETGRVSIARANAHVTYPARVQVVAAMNPCRCGHLGDPAQGCGKAPKCALDYQSRISGPLFDRIDLHVDVPAVSAADLSLPPPAEGSAEVAARVTEARARQTARYAAHKLRCNAEVKRIMVEDGRATGVQLATGEQLSADIVVCNSDTAWTYRNLVAPEHRRHWTDQRIERGRYSMSLFVWYFGTDRQYTDVPHHTMVLGPRYEGLLNDIFRHHRLADDFSLYLHRPSATDPSVAPSGCDTFYVLSPVPHLQSGTDWAQQAEPYRQAVCRRLEETLLPGLSQHVISSHVMTPQNFQDDLLSFKGAAFGLEPLLLQSAWFRPHNRSEDVENLFMVGASTHPGAGVPGVLMSAKALQTVVPQLHGSKHV